MVDYLKGEGFHVGRKLVSRLMALMDIKAIYPRKSLSKGGWARCLDQVPGQHLDRALLEDHQAGVYLLGPRG